MAVGGVGYYFLLRWVLPRWSGLSSRGRIVLLLAGLLSTVSALEAFQHSNGTPRTAQPQRNTQKQVKTAFFMYSSAISATQ